MRYCLQIVFCLFMLAPFTANAQTTPGERGFQAIKRCVMENNIGLCHRAITPDSYALFDKFVSYKLMPCLPTDFEYQNEEKSAGRIHVTAEAPAAGNMRHIMHMMFDVTPAGVKLNLPESLARGMGPNWENKIQLSEQLFLMMRQNMGDKLNCDALTGLMKR